MQKLIVFLAIRTWIDKHIAIKTAQFLPGALFRSCEKAVKKQKASTIRSLWQPVWQKLSKAHSSTCEPQQRWSLLFGRVCSFIASPRYHLGTDFCQNCLCECVCVCSACRRGLWLKIADNKHAKNRRVWMKKEITQREKERGRESTVWKRAVLWGEDTLRRADTGDRWSLPRCRDAWKCWCVSLISMAS